MLRDPLSTVRPAGGSAILGAGGTVGHAELHARARDLARRLAGRTSPVLLYGHKQPEMLAGMLAALQVRRPYIPVDSSLPPARAARIVEIGRPGDAIAAEPLPQAVAASLARVAGAASPAAAGLAYILFTSGTTGEPKGVQIPRRALAHFTGWLLATQRLRRGAEVFLNQAPLHFDLSVMDVYGALLTGGAILPLLREEIGEPRRLFGRLDGAPLTVWVSTPSFARFCLAERRFTAAMLPRLRRFLFCGETLPPAVARQLTERFPDAEVWNFYGPTEATVAVTAVRITREAASSGAPLPVGAPAPGMSVWCAEPGEPGEPSRPLPAGRMGEIVIAGPQVARGYLGVPPAARSAFFLLADGRPAYRSGDLGHVGADGMLYCHGRIDRQVKLHGYRLELDEVESCLRALPGVADAAVLVARRDGLSDHLVAFLLPADDAAGTALPVAEPDLTRAVRASLALRLPAYALPRAVRLLAAPPLNANGKLDRRTLEGLLTR